MRLDNGEEIFFQTLGFSCLLQFLQTSLGERLHPRLRKTPWLQRTNGVIVVDHPPGQAKAEWP